MFDGRNHCFRRTVATGIQCGKESPPRQLFQTPTPRALLRSAAVSPRPAAEITPTVTPEVFSRAIAFLHPLRLALGAHSRAILGRARCPHRAAPFSGDRTLPPAQLNAPRVQHPALIPSDRWIVGSWMPSCINCSTFPTPNFFPIRIHWRPLARIERLILLAGDDTFFWPAA